MEQIIEKAKAFVEEYMSQYDASHDFNHIKRVLTHAKTIEARESITHPDARYRSDLITLASLLHDVGDKKYLKPGQDGTKMVEKILVDFGADVKCAANVQKIVNHVSYSNEIRDPISVQQCLHQFPELAIVQDADRLDAIGAVGIGRCFPYTAAVGKNSLDVAIAHFQEKLEKLQSMMKTDSGKEIASSRNERLKEFRTWWIEETDHVCG